MRWSQVNFSLRWGRRRLPGNVGYDSYAGLRAVDLRLGWGSFGRPSLEKVYTWDHGMPPMVDSYTRPVTSSEGVRFRKEMAEIAERPPMTRVLQEPPELTADD
jgi:hypothetical protein